MGPNVQKLITRRMAKEMIPDGGGFLAGLNALRNVGDYVGPATTWVEEAIAAVKAAPDNPYGDDDEAIAGEVLRQIENK